jgi:two-component system nitrogen regulation sensor histidine kinase GlnL
MHCDPANILQALPDGVVALGPDGRVDWVNAEACRLLEQSSDVLIGGDLGRLLGAEHPVARLARTAIERGRPAVQDEVPLERRRGESVVVDLTVTPLDDDERQNLGALLVLRDRTIRSSLREMVSQRERLDSYGQIAAGIAHEVKNPLGGIRGAAELLQLWAKDDRGRETAGLIVREVDRIASLVEELMVFARGEELHESEVNVHFILDGVLDLLSHDPLAEQLEIERFYDPSIPEFLADADRLTQVFLNLCRNAAQAMETGGGHLTITTRMSLDRRIAIADGRRVPAVVIAVSDTGPGIPGDVLERLDTPFFTTKSSGTGLGLAVSRHWVTQHGGSLRVASQPGQGTTVRVSLPLRRPIRKSGKRLIAAPALGETTR